MTINAHAAADPDVSVNTPGKEAAAEKTKDEAKPEKPPADGEVPVDDEAKAEEEEAQIAAVARPVPADPVQVYGWRERIKLKDVEETLQAKLDSGALTSSIHAEEKELFERDGKKWVRFIVTDTGSKTPIRTRVEAPLVRTARIKEPGGESISREVVRLHFQIGDRTLKGEFSLNDRSNMLAPVLLGRSVLKELGWVDSSRTNLADQKIFR